MAGDKSDDWRPRPPITQQTKPLRATGALPVQPPPPLEEGFVLGGRYEIEECVGEGGAGSVFRARDRHLGKQLVAVKVLRSDRAADRKWVERFQREVLVAREIQHPHVCRVFDFGKWDGHWALTMEYADGGTLRDVLERRSLVQGRQSVILQLSDLQKDADPMADARAVCAGLAAIHAVGIIHRDITPGNVLRLGDGRLVLADFGLAIGAKDETTFHGGTPRYMAPEVHALKPADQRSDVWQLGYLLHEILFRRHPQWIQNGDRMVLLSPASRDASPVEQELAQLCCDCLDHNPERRPSNAVEVAGRLAAAEQAKPPGLATRAGRWAARAIRHRAFWIPLMGLLLAGGIAKIGQTMFRRSLCRGGSSRIADVWTSSERTKARQAFTASDQPNSGATFEVVDQALRSHLDQWLATYADACEATHVRGEQSPQVLDLRMACLNEDLESVRQIGEVFAEADRDVVPNAVQAVSSLKSVERCSNTQELKGAAAAPSSSTQAAIDEVRKKLAAATVLSDTGRYSAALEAARPLVQEARLTGFCPVIAEALFTRGYAGEQMISTAAYEGDLEEAVYTAERCGRDKVVAMASAALVYAERFNPNPTIPERWAKLAQAALDRTGGDQLVECSVVGNTAAAEHHRGDFQAAVDDYRRALELATLVHGTDHLDVGLVLVSLSDALKDLGSLTEALEVNDRAIKILVKWLGSDHFDVAAALSNRGDVLVAMKRLPEAQLAYSSSLAVFEKRLPPKDFRCPYPLAGLGQVLLETGHPRDATMKLENALKQIDEDGDRFFRAGVQASLGRALCESGDDCKRGRNLAVEAMKTYATSFAYSRQSDAVATWLKGAGEAGRSKRPPARRSSSARL